MFVPNISGFYYRPSFTEGPGFGGGSQIPDLVLNNVWNDKEVLQVVFPVLERASWLLEDVACSLKGDCSRGGSRFQKSEAAGESWRVLERPGESWVLRSRRGWWLWVLFTGRVQDNPGASSES